MFIIIFYAIPVGIAIWWLILFTRKPIVAMFSGGQAAAIVAGDLVDDSGFPARPPSQRVPLPISILGWFFIVSACTVVFVFLQPPATVLFGHLLKGTAVSSSSWPTAWAMPRVELAFLDSNTVAFG